ncbi:MAG: hypothetical protein MK008_05085 [Bdellovibrionales bacterium]|nr:hypothetical protein [Bdellovibrionales bacterium]
MKALNNNYGFNLVQLLIATSVFTIVSLGVMNLILYYTKMEQQQRLLSGIISARYTIISYLQHERGWAFTMTAPENNEPVSADCLTSDTSITGTGSNFDCFGVADVELVVYSPSGDAYYDPDNASLGFNRDGAICDTYDSTAGSGDFNCPFRAEVYWRTLCTASPCYYPGIEVEVRFEMNQSDGEKRLAFNPENYNFVFQK